MARHDLPAPIIALVGPTGSGKTAALLRLAETLPVEVISADSVQAVRGFDIGSAKPTPAEQAHLPHHLIDVVGPRERYDAWRFARDAEAVARERRGEVALVATAGTGLYLGAWSDPLPALPDIEPERRRALGAEVRRDPAGAHERLAALDPASGARIHPNDWRRLARALEIAEATGMPPTEAYAAYPAPRGRPLILLGIRGEGPAYDAQLARRVETMLAAGWIEEVEELMARYGPDLPALEAVGYRQIVEMLAGRLPRAELTEAIRIATRRYAKRQRTWFRRLDVRWFPFRPDRPDPALMDGLRKAVEMSYNLG